jgi:hypothetical protein
MLLGHILVQLMDSLKFSMFKTPLILNILFPNYLSVVAEDSDLVAEINNMFLDNKCSNYRGK